MLSPLIDLPSFKQAYAQNGAAVIHNVLDPRVVKDLEKALNEIPWVLQITEHDTDRILSIPLPDKRVCLDNLPATLKNFDSDLEFEKLFFVRMTHEPELFEHPLLLEFQEFLNSPDFLTAMIQMTGKSEITHTYISATRYERNCFLGSHSDGHDESNCVAMIFNLTREWHLDWGGHLIINFPGKPMPVLAPPIFNTLSLMNVPVDHFVSSVSPVATGKRQALSGWLRH